MPLAPPTWDGLLLATAAAIVGWLQWRILRRQNDIQQSQTNLQARLVDETTQHYQAQRPRLKIDTTQIFQRQARDLGPSSPLPDDESIAMVVLWIKNEGGATIEVPSSIHAIDDEGRRKETFFLGADQASAEAGFRRIGGTALEVPAHSTRCAWFVLHHRAWHEGRCRAIRIEPAGHDPIVHHLPFLAAPA